MEDIKLNGKKYSFKPDYRFAQVAGGGFGGLFYDEPKHTVGYFIGIIKIYFNFEPKMKIENIDDFRHLVEIFEKTCSKYENYSYYDLAYDIYAKLTTEDEGPTKEIILNQIFDTVATRKPYRIAMYHYAKMEKVAAKIGCETKIFKEVNFSNIDDFTIFAKEAAKFCRDNGLDLIKDYSIDDPVINPISEHLKLRKAFIDKGEEMKANILNVSFCKRMAPSALVYYNNKKTILFFNTIKDCKRTIDCTPVKLDEDFQDVKKFREWINDIIRPDCVLYDKDGQILYRRTYESIIKELNEQYDERHKNESFVEELNQANNDKQLVGLVAGIPNNIGNEGRQQ